MTPLEAARRSFELARCYFTDLELREQRLRKAAAEVREVFGERLHYVAGGMASVKALVDLVDGGSR